MATEHIYKKIEVIGTSSKSIEKAITNAVSKASDSLDQLRWFEVKEIRGAIDGDEVEEWQVGVNMAFTLKDKNAAAGETVPKQSKPVK